jgi:O-antigen/teichoic acid export membrane protein
VASLAGLYALRRYVFGSGAELGLRAAWRTMRPYVGYAITVFAITSLTQVVQKLDIVIVEGFRGPSSAGRYAVAVQLGDVLLVIPAALGYLVFRQGALSRPRHWGDLFQALRWTLAVTAVGALAMGLVADPLLRAVFGDAYAGATRALVPLLPGVVLLAAQSVISNYLAGRGRPRAVLVAWTITAIASVAGTLAVVPTYGIAGAGVVSSVSYALVLGLHLRILRTLRPRGGEAQPAQR